MLIGIDGNEANIVNRVGVNTYAFEIIWGLYRLVQKEAKDHRLIVYLKEKPLSDLPKPSKNFSYKILPGGKVWILTRLMPHLFFTSQKPALLFAPSHYLPPLSPVPQVCAIMDLGYLEFSGQFKKYDFWQLKYWSAISIFISKYIIAISNATREDIVRHYKFAAKKIKVTALAYDQKIFHPAIPLSNVRRIKNRYSIVNDYVLFLSTLKPSKNLEGLVKAFAVVCKNTDRKIQLVIAGKKGWMYESVYELVKLYKLEDKVVFTDFIAEEDKPALIKGATVFVSPSFWEGFGLHVLESMAIGTPVVVSNKGSLAEVVGSAGIVVDPYNTKSIAQGINAVLNLNKVEYDKLAEKCVLQAQKFDWDKTARLTLDILLEANV